MKSSLFVCLILAATMAATTIVITGQEGAVPDRRPMRQGVSVQLPSSTNASSMPEADDRDSWIVTVTQNGTLYFDAQPLSAEELADQMKRRPRKRTEKLYVKVDARTPLTNVQQVLQIGSEMFFQSAVLLTVQHERPVSGIVSPQGLEVQIVAPATGSGSSVVEVLGSGQGISTLKINNHEIAWSDLKPMLMRATRQGQKGILVSADGRLPFAKVVQVVDACRSVSADIFLSASKSSPCWRRVDRFFARMFPSLKN
jgi:biopolymer transport protein ExbD